MTIKEIEAACDAEVPLDFSRHPQEVDPLALNRIFYPLGFPVEVRTNAPEILEMYEELWGLFKKRYATPPIVSSVHVVEGGSTECPPVPVYRLLLPRMTGISDPNNYSIIDFERNTAQMVISRESLRHRQFVKHSLLGTAGSGIASRYATSIHAGCVSLDGRGVLLCGDSGAGKSTLSYACARAGWTYTSDDGSYVCNGGDDLLVSGDFFKVRFRPTAGELFPEVRGLEIVPNQTGKASMELRPPALSHITSSQTAQAHFLVYLNRNFEGPPTLVPYRKDVARYSMQQVLYGLPENQVMQAATIERVLALPVLELRYTDLDWAIDRLQRLVREGQ